ncbi:MAG: LLM class flavin-dependent oxidoreductase [Acidimicrobiales bacterium]
MRFGVGLWTMQATAAGPASTTALYRELLDDARLVESLGYESMWLAEHRFWYDGWCPAPLIAMAATASATTRLRFGTAMMLLPQHDPQRFAALVGVVDRLSERRLDVGVGLGHRDAEFDGLGLRRRDRGRRMDRAVGALAESGPPIWIGGMAPAALQRSFVHGLNYLLPQTLYVHELRDTVASIHAAAAHAGRRPGRIGLLKDAWIGDDGPATRDWFLPRLRDHYCEEAGAWWILKGVATGFEEPDLLERQLDRITDTALVGSPDEVAAGVAELEAAGVELVVLRFAFDVTRDSGVREVIARFASDVMPRFGGLEP